MLKHLNMSGKTKRAPASDRYDLALLERVKRVARENRTSKRAIIEQCLDAHLHVLERMAGIVPPKTK